MKITAEEAKQLVKWGFDQGLLSIRWMSAVDRMFVAKKLHRKVPSPVHDMNNTQMYYPPTEKVPDESPPPPPL